MRWLKRLSWLLLPVLALAALVAGALHYFASQERVFEPRVVAYDLKAGSPLRVAAASALKARNTWGACCRKGAM